MQSDGLDKVDLSGIPESERPVHAQTVALEFRAGALTAQDIEDAACVWWCATEIEKLRRALQGGGE